MLEQAPEFFGALRFNEFSNTIELWDDGWRAGGDLPRSWNDADESALLRWAQVDVFPTMARNKILPAVQYIALKRACDPLKDYLDGLVWDEEERLDWWLTDYMGAAGNADYIKAVGRMWLISAVARAYEPGCQADHMLVLEGAQGLYKSSALRALVPFEDWFSDDISSMRGDKDDKLALHGRWIIEVKELEALRKAEIGSIKSFIDTRIDKIRVPYGRSVESFERRCVLAGTYNPTGHGYLKDASGGRRFWPVTVSQLADVEGLTSIRDQLWAEAVRCYQGGEPWWTHDHVLQQLIEAEQEDRYQADPLEDLIHSYIESECIADDSAGPQNIKRAWMARKTPLETFFTHNFCEDVLLRSVENVPRISLNIIGQSMTRLGWKKGKYHNPRTQRSHQGWRRPDDQNQPPTPPKPKWEVPVLDATDELVDIPFGPFAAVEALKTSQSGDKWEAKGEVDGEVVSAGGTSEKAQTSHSSHLTSLGDHTIVTNTPIGVVVKVFDTEWEVGLKAAREAVAAALADGAVGFDLETVGLFPGGENRVRLMQIWRDNHELIIDLDGCGGLAPFGDLLADGELITFNGLFEMRWLADAGIDVVVDDLALIWSAIYGGPSSLASVVKATIGVEMDKALQKSDWSGDLTQAQLTYALDDARYTLMAWRHLTKIMSEGQIRGYDLFRNALRPTLRMMMAGVAIDLDAHKAFIQHHGHRVDWADGWLERHVEDVSNWSSGPQVSAWLDRVLPAAVKASWPRTDKTNTLKTGAEAYKTGASKVDRNLRRIFWALQIRAASGKLVSTYGDSLLTHIKDGRLHGQFSIGRAITGRMSSSKPNLQNMPGRGPLGKAFRQLFTAPPGRCLVVADYSQIEVRVGGILADEPVLAGMFARGHDVHSATAAASLGLDYEDVIDSKRKPLAKYAEARAAAKAITFGMQYGMGDRTLAGQLGITVQEARKRIAEWEETFPKVAAWRIESARTSRRAKGFVLHSGRTITLDYKPSPQAGYNYPVQGAAGDVIYAALAEIDTALEGLDAEPILVVHDEIVLECAEADAEAAKERLEAAMVRGFLEIFPDGETRGLVGSKISRIWEK